MTAFSSALMFQFVWQAQAPLPEPRAALLHAVVGGRLLAAGGTYWKDERKFWGTRCDLFDPATNSWSTGPALPVPRADSASAEVRGEFLYFGGTSNGRVLDDVLAFDGVRWYGKPEMRLPAPRSYSQAAVIERRIYLFGGLEKIGDIATARRDVWVWDLDHPRDRWQQISQMPEPARSNFAVLNGKALFFGGVAPTQGGFRNLSESWSYDFGKNRWESLPPVPLATRAWAAAVRDGSVFIFGGYTDQFARTILRFHPQSREFTPAGELPRGLADVRFFAIKDSLFVTGGESGMKIRSGETWRGTGP
jgi:N-acetylneuraminic acid mutarotase